MGGGVFPFNFFLNKMGWGWGWGWWGDSTSKGEFTKSVFSLKEVGVGWGWGVTHLCKAGSVVTFILLIMQSKITLTQEKKRKKEKQLKHKLNF